MYRDVADIMGWKWPRQKADRMKAESIVDTLLEHCGSCPEDFDQQELAMGRKVEMEHTDNPEEATRIAIDHLKERGDYYSFGKKKGVFPELAEMEQRRAANFKSNFVVSRTLGELGYGKRAAPSKACWHSWSNYHPDLNGKPRWRCIKCGEKRFTPEPTKAKALFMAGGSMGAMTGSAGAQM